MTSPLYGWLLFGSVLIIALTGSIMIGSRRQLRSVADRKEFAAERGWLYEDKNSQLGQSWQDLFGKKAVYMMSPFGVLAGEVEGLPFTVAQQLPADLADRFGTPPSTDIPLHGQAGAAQKLE